MSTSIFQFSDNYWPQKIIMNTPKNTLVFSQDGNKFIESNIAVLVFHHNAAREKANRFLPVFTEYVTSLS